MAGSDQRVLEDIKIVSMYKDSTDDPKAYYAFSRLEEILEAWKKNKHIEEHTVLRRMMRGKL